MAVIGRPLTLACPASYLCDVTGWFGNISYEVGVDVFRRRLKDPHMYVVCIQLSLFDGTHLGFQYQHTI